LKRCAGGGAGFHWCFAAAGRGGGGDGCCGWPGFQDKTVIQVCIDKIPGNPIKHSGTQFRINQIQPEFTTSGSIEQSEWSFLAGTAASLRGATVTKDML